MTKRVTRTAIKGGVGRTKSGNEGVGKYKRINKKEKKEKKRKEENFSLVFHAGVSIRHIQFLT